MPAALTVGVAGLLFGLSLIVVIGPQNAFVLRVGVQGRGVGLVVGVCAAADAALIAAGTAGAGAVIRGTEWALTVVRVAGVIFLLGYAALALRRALRGENPASATAPDHNSLGALLIATLALTFLNPGVYLDTVVLLGSVANSHAGAQWWFALGAAIGSALWFGVIGFGARRLGRYINRPSTWRWLDGFVALVMVITAIRLWRG